MNQATMLTPAQAIIVTGFTGVMLCDLDDFLADLNARTGAEPPFAKTDLHQDTFEEKIKPIYAADCQAIIPVDWDKESRREEEANKAELAELATGERPKIVIARD